MSQRALLAALAGAVTSFLAGWLIYGILLMDFYKANTIVYEGLMKEPPVLWGIFVSGFCSSLLFSLIFFFLSSCYSAVTVNEHDLCTVTVMMDNVVLSRRFDDSYLP